MATGSATTSGLTLRPTGNAVRIETWLHDMTTTGTLLTSTALGLDISIQSSQQLLIQHLRSSASCSVTWMALSPVPTELRVRAEIRPGGTDGYGALLCELFNQNGDRIWRKAVKISSPSAGSGTVLTLDATAAKIAFVRVLSTVATSANANLPPVPYSADADRLYEWKLDGDLTASVGGVNLTGTVTYSTTPNPGPLVILTATPTRLDAISSVRSGIESTINVLAASLRDDSAAVTCKIGQTNGPATLRISSQTSCAPGVIPPVRGSYALAITTTDAGGSTTRSLSLPAVATDTNGNIVTANATQDAILMGPAKRLGLAEPAAVDGQSTKMAIEQVAYQQTSLYPVAGPVWATKGTGTIAYTYGGVGFGFGTNGTTITSGINSTDTSIAVANASLLNLATLPTYIIISTNLSGVPYSGTAYELIKISATTGTTGAQTLTVAARGRGVYGQTIGNVAVVAQSWSSGAQVGQPMVVTGTGTLFATDTVKPLCPAGVPGPSGAVTYSAGTVAVTAGSASITGTGTSWTGNVTVGQIMRISTTAGAAAPFWAAVSNVVGNTSITLDRVVPASIDTASGLTYAIVSQPYLNLGYTMQDVDTVPIAGGIGEVRTDGLNCESETSTFAMPWFDMSSRGITGVAQTGMRYSLSTASGCCVDSGPNFYGTDLALFQQYLRSGNDAARTLGLQISNYWIKDPEQANGPNQILRQGGGIRGAIACKASITGCTLDWRDIRAFARRIVAPTSCDQQDIDPRNAGYGAAIMADMLAADPDATARGVWSSKLSDFYTWANTCQLSGTFATSGGYFNQMGPQGTFTNGSATVTAVTTFDGGYCDGTDNSGGLTATATNGSTNLTGTGFTAGGAAISISDASGNYMRLNYAFVSSTQITLSAAWAYPTGSVRWMISSSADSYAAGADFTDVSLNYNFDCSGSGASITLDRPWPGTTGQRYLMNYNIAGRGSQSFMLGILGHGLMKASYARAAYSSDPGFSTIEPTVSEALRNTGWRSDVGAFRYGFGFQMCGPSGTPAVGVFRYTIPNCQVGIESNGIGEGRDLTGETMAAIASRQRLSPDATTVTWGDSVFNALWCSPWDADISTCDLQGGLLNSNSTIDTGMASYKWPGFFFGVGASHQWPSVRTGATAPADPQTATYAYPASSPWRTSFVRVAPSGESVTVSCPSSPCASTWDARQGGLGLIN